MSILAAVSLIRILELGGLIVAAIIALGIVVFIHEWGHFMAGRRAGIRAEAFSIGFGPVLWRRKVGETEYRLSAILFGGYVKFAGMEGTADKTPQEIERGFYAASPGRRIFTTFAGPFMNAVLAFVLFFVLWATGRKVHESEATTVIGGLLDGSAAEQAGLRPGDRILSISGRNVARWIDVLMGIRLGGDPLKIEFERAGRVMHLEVKPDYVRKVPKLGIEPQYQAVVRVVQDGTEAERMGLLPDDRLLKLNGERVYNGESWFRELPRHAGEPIEITVEREGETLALKGTMPVAEAGKQAILGFGLGPAREFVTIRENPVEASVYCLDMVGRTLKGLVTRRVQAKELGGPIFIVSAIVVYLSVSFTSFLWLAAFISLNFVVINLLPIPVVDGGHIVFSLVEAVRRKPMREKTMAIITNAFAVLIIAFFLYITFYDIKRLIPSREEESTSPAADKPAAEQAEPEAPEPAGAPVE